MDKYVVLCDCDGRAHEVAYIDDDRADGGWIHLEPNVHELATRPLFRGTSVKPNRLGDPNQAVGLRCAGCGATISTITDARVGDIVDGLGSVRDELEMIRPSRPWDEPASGYEEQYRQALLAGPAPWDEGYEDRGSWWPEGIPRVTHYEDRIVIPFQVLRSLNSRLPKRRD